MQTPLLIILNLSRCCNLVDADFGALEHCKKLDQLYLSCTNIPPETTVTICIQLRLTVLDLSVVCIKPDVCDRLIDEWMIQLYVSFPREVEESEINVLGRRHLDCSIYTKI